MDNKQKSVNIKNALIQMSDLFNSIKENNSTIDTIALTEKNIVINMAENGNYVIKTDSISSNEILEKMFPEFK